MLFQRNMAHSKNAKLAYFPKLLCLRNSNHHTSMKSFYFFPRWRSTANTSGSASSWTVSRCSISITASARWCPSTPSRSAAASASPNWTELETRRSETPSRTGPLIYKNRNVSAKTQNLIVRHQFRSPVWTFGAAAVDVNRSHSPARVTVLNLAIYIYKINKPVL